MVPPQIAPVLGFQFSGGSVGGNHVHPVLLEVVIQPIAVIRAIANEMFGLGLQHVKVETELHQRDFMMIGRVCAYRERQPMTIHNRKDLHAFAPAGRADALAAALGRGKRRVDETLTLVDGPFLAQRIRQLRENLAQHFALAPLLKPAMHRFVVGIALRQQVPLCARVQHPEHRLQDRSCRHRRAARATLRDVFLGEMFPDPGPLVVAQAQHALTDTYGYSSCQPF